MQEQLCRHVECAAEFSVELSMEFSDDDRPRRMQTAGCAFLFEQ
jgi:hypothetical protein